MASNNPKKRMVVVVITESTEIEMANGAISLRSFSMVEITTSL